MVELSLYEKELYMLTLLIYFAISPCAEEG